jgi:hypothetical protein
MKKKIKQQIEVEIAICNICGKEVNDRQFAKARIKIVRGLMKTTGFDAHDACVNRVIREAFKKFV